MVPTAAGQSHGTALAALVLLIVLAVIGAALLHIVRAAWAVVEVFIRPVFTLFAAMALLFVVLVVLLFGAWAHSGTQPAPDARTPLPTTPVHGAVQAEHD